MNQNAGIRPTAGKIVFGTIVAVIVGLVEPFLLSLQLMLPMPALNVAGVLAVALYAYAGVVPACVLGVLSIAGIVVGFGGSAGLVALPMCLIPPIVILWGLRTPKPFFRQMTVGILAALGATTLSAVLAGIVFGGELIGQLMDMVAETFQANKDAIWSALQPSFATAGIQLTAEEFSDLYLQLLQLLRMYYEYHSLANLLTGAVLTAVLSVFWGNWLEARRGNATVDSFKGLHEWSLPANVTWGLLMTLVASAVLNVAGVSGGMTVWIVVSDLAQLAFIIQAFSAIDRRLKARGSSRGRRTGTVVLVLLASVILSGFALMQILAVAGCASALFGRKGAARPIVEKVRKMINGDDQ